MPLNQQNSRTFHWSLYAGMLETMTYHAIRTNGNVGGTAVMTDYTVYNCRRKKYDGGGEQLVDGITSRDLMTIQVSDFDMDAAGAPTPQLNDEITMEDGERWLVLTSRRQLFRNIQNIYCRRMD